MAELEREIWGMFPVVLVGKMRDPWHRELKKLLSTYKISPPPMILEIDQRSDAQHLVPLLARLLGKEGLPQVIVGGKTIGGYKDVTA
jgi:glutaredoxin